MSAFYGLLTLWDVWLVLGLLARVKRACDHRRVRGQYYYYAGLVKLAPWFRRRRGLWFVDNTAALMALIKGRSGNAALDHLAGQIHCAAYALDCLIHFEWIPSSQNWADGISRNGPSDSTAYKLGFPSRWTEIDTTLWQLPLRVTKLVFSYL